jgi:hypothetical protein
MQIRETVSTWGNDVVPPIKTPRNEQNCIGRTRLVSSIFDLDPVHRQLPPRACPSPAVVAPARALAVASPALASCCSGALKSPISVEFPNLCSGVALSKSPLPPYRCLWISPKFPWSRCSPHAVAAGGRLPRTAVERLLAAEGFLPRWQGAAARWARRPHVTGPLWALGRDAAVACLVGIFGDDGWDGGMEQCLLEISSAVCGIMCDGG